MKKCISFLFAMLFLLAGCQEQPVVDPSITESLVWETMPALTYGQMESEKLKVEPWYCGRTEVTSRNEMAETQLGYYYLNTSGGGQFFFYYSDKADFGNWVRVCNKPACTHSFPGKCPALVSANEFLIKDNRIFYLTDCGWYPELNIEKNGRVLVSRALDGSDFQLEHVLEEAMIGDSGGVCYTWMTSNFWLYNSSILTPEGMCHMRSFLVNENGEHLIGSAEAESETTVGVFPVSALMRGDPVYRNYILDRNLCYRVVGDTMEPVDLSGLDTYSGYLSGNVLRCFKPNDGYYDVDLSTRQEVKLADARMENSSCQMLLPNCIVESTLFYPISPEARTEGMIHALYVFDGENWHDVELPEELKNARKSEFILVQAVTSDSILFRHSDASGRVFYRIDLNAKQWKLELVNPQ